MRRLGMVMNSINALYSEHLSNIQAFSGLPRAPDAPVSRARRGYGLVDSDALYQTGSHVC